MADMPHARFVIGIDEAGRGPLAGPLVVGAVAISDTPQRRKSVQHSVLHNRVLHELSIHVGVALRDSKQLTAVQREAWFAALEEAQVRGDLWFEVAFVSAGVIDARGISAATRLAVARVLGRLALAPEQSSVLLDGLLVAPARFRAQRTIIRGDETEPLISLASIAAKVLRDRYMVSMAGRFPSYGFERHKGYGTRAHYRALGRYGPCAIHRRRFLHSVF